MHTMLIGASKANTVGVFTNQVKTLRVFTSKLTLLSDSEVFIFKNPSFGW